VPNKLLSWQVFGSWVFFVWEGQWEDRRLCIWGRITRDYLRKEANYTRKRKGQRKPGWVGKCPTTWLCFATYLALDLYVYVPLIAWSLLPNFWQFLIHGFQAKPLLSSGEIKELVDPLLGNDYDCDEMERMTLAASLCTRTSTQSRPEMSEVGTLWLHEKITNSSSN
jgi:hypothetical protein